MSPTKILQLGHGHVIYDGDCGICTHTIKFLSRLNWLHAVTFHSNTDPRTYEQFRDVTIERTQKEILAFVPDQGWYGGIHACEWIFCRIPVLWPIVPFTLIPGFTILGDYCYKWVAERRHKISKFFGLKACKLP